MVTSLLQFAPLLEPNGFCMEGYWIWCPSIIKGDDGFYHLFASRWPKWLPMHPGWMTHSEVVRAISKTPQGPYSFVEVVLPARGAEYWDGCATHNPTIRFHAGVFYLFYTGISYPFPAPTQNETFNIQDVRCVVARASKRVGVATSKSLSGNWARFNKPILAPEPSTFYSMMTSNPAPCIEFDGSVKMLFKARAYEGQDYGDMKIGIATAGCPEGPYSIVPNNVIFNSSEFNEIEDPFLWKENGEYHMIAKDMTGRLCGESGAGVYAQSTDFLSWRVGIPSLAYSRNIVRSEGRSDRLGHLERPFIFRDTDNVRYFCAATCDGPGGFHLATKSRITIFKIQEHNN